MEKIKEEIMEAAIRSFREKGLKFTLDDLVKDLHIAKKTVYKYYSSKEDLLVGLTDYGFERIHAGKRAILEQDLPLKEKIRRVMIALPDQYQAIDFRQLGGLGDKYPVAAARLREHLETDWEPVTDLLEQGQEEGILRPFSLPVLRVMVASSIDSFLSQPIAGMGYQEALDAMMDIVMKGIVNDDQDQ